MMDAHDQSYKLLIGQIGASCFRVDTHSGVNRATYGPTDITVVGSLFNTSTSPKSVVVIYLEDA